MAEILPYNGLQSTLTGALTTGSTTLSIQPGDAGFWPTGGEYRAVLCTDPNNGPWELVQIISGQGTANPGVTRAVESYNGDQTAKAWPSGSYIAAVITHDSLQLAGGSQGYTVHEEFLPINGATTITLSTNPAQGIGVVSRNGVVQSTTDNHYTQAGAVLTFSTPFTGTERVVVGYTVGTTGAQGPPGTPYPNGFPPGTLAAPGWYVTGDSNTGLYSPAVDQIALAAGGTAGLVLSTTRLQFTADATYDFGGWAGATGYGRPNNLYVANGVSALFMALGNNYTLGTGAPQAILSFFGQPVTTGSYQFGIDLNIVAQAPVTYAYGIHVQWGTGYIAGGFTATTFAQIYIDWANLTNNTTITNGYGLYVRNQGQSQYVNAYGIYIENVYGATTTSISMYNAGSEQVMGTVGFGAAPVPTVGLTMKYSNLTTNRQWGVDLTPTFNSGATFEAIALQVQLKLASVTNSNSYSIFVSQPAYTSSTSTNSYGLYISNMGYPGGISNAYGIYINAQVGASSQNVGLYNGGTSYFAGNVGVGASGGVASRGLYVWFPVTTGASQYACELDAWVSSSATTEGGVLELWYNSVNATFTTPSVSGLRIMQPMIGTGNTITNYYGIRVDNQGAQGVGIVNNYGIYIFSQSGATTTNIGLYNAGTTQLQGAAAFGTAPIASQVTFGMNVRQTSGDATFLRGGSGGGTDPAYDLRVNGSIYVGGSTSFGSNISTPASITAGGPMTAQYFVTDGDYRGGSVNVDRNGLNDGTMNQPWLRFAGGGEGIMSKRTSSGGNQYDLEFWTGNNLRMQIDNGGHVGIGTTATSQSAVALYSQNMTGANQLGMDLEPFFSSATTASGYIIFTRYKTLAASFTMTSGGTIWVGQPQLGSGNTVTTMYGVYVDNQSSFGGGTVTNAYGIYIAAQSGATTTNVGLYNAGTSTFVGAVTHGSSSTLVLRAEPNFATAWNIEQNPTGAIAFLPSNAGSYGAGIWISTNAYFDGTAYQAYNAGTVSSYFNLSPTGFGWGLAPAAASPGIRWVFSLQTSGTSGASIWIGSTNEMIRNPVNSALHLSVESRDGYLMLCSAQGTHVAYNAYWDGTAWQVINAANYCNVFITSNNQWLWYGATTVNSVGWGVSMTLTNAGILTVGSDVYAGGGSATNSVWATAFRFGTSGTSYYMARDTGSNSLRSVGMHMMSDGNLYFNANSAIYIGGWDGTYIHTSHSIAMNGSTLVFSNNGGVYLQWNGSVIVTPNNFQANYLYTNDGGNGVVQAQAGDLYCRSATGNIRCTNQGNTPGTVFCTTINAGGGSFSSATARGYATIQTNSGNGDLILGGASSNFYMHPNLTVGLSQTYPQLGVFGFASILCNGVTTNSSRRYKRDIQPIRNAMAMVMDPEVEGTHYLYNPPLAVEKDVPKFGLIAEPWQRIAPDVVSLDEDGAPMSMDYQQVTAIL